MSIVDKPLSEEWTFPYESSAYFFSKRLAKKIQNKYAYVGLAYLDQDGKAYKQELFHGIVLSASLGGIQIRENGTGKTKTLPPDLRAWKHAKKGPYKDRETGQVLTNVDYVASWFVTPGSLLSPVVVNEKLTRGNGSFYNVDGCGTRLIGKANKQRDGSYTATKWFILLYAPIWPLGTYRISGSQRTATLDFGLHGSHNADPLFLDVTQVLMTYALWLPLVVLFIWLALATR